MSLDREFRPEALDVGDSIVRGGVLHRIMGKQLGATCVYLRLLDESAGVWRTVFYRPGCWVAAVPAVRS